MYVGLHVCHLHICVLSIVGIFVSVCVYVCVCLSGRGLDGVVSPYMLVCMVGLRCSSV